MVAALQTALAILEDVPQLGPFVDNIYPLYAEEGVEGLYITYKVDENATATKSGVTQDRLTVAVFDTNYLHAAELADHIKDFFTADKRAGNFFHEATASDYTEDLKEAFVIVSFTFKHK
ncbi:hypothetical protein [Leeuwenhoekiella sp. LLG6367-2.1]|uniref:hypothetical protein n=1 Tax=Leeuwenhoekiella sp. LLG6367-2.1 TaxID=3160833 RepID=UPI0038705E1A